jgi:superfamily II DNA or RNA helicase
MRPFCRVGAPRHVSTTLSNEGLNAYENFNLRLALTATYERSDDGTSDFLTPYFGGLCYSLHYRQALAEDIIAHFKIAFIKITLATWERDKYDEWNDIEQRARFRLINRYGIEAQPFGEFMRAVQTLVKSTDSDDATFTARRYIWAFNKRRELLAGCSGKLNAVQSVIGAVGQADRTIAFTQTVEAANQVIDILQRHGLRSAIVQGSFLVSERRLVLDKFRRGTIRAIAAPKKNLMRGSTSRQPI